MIMTQHIRGCTYVLDSKHWIRIYVVEIDKVYVDGLEALVLEQSCLLVNENISVF